MPLILTAGPTCEPVPLTEAKIHCRVDNDNEDALLASLILAARLHVEQSLNLALIRQSWSLYLDAWPTKAWVELPLSPLISVNAVRLYSAPDIYTTLDPDSYFVDTISRRPRLARAVTLSWPIPGRAVNGIEIAFTAGFGENVDDVPMPLRQAIKMLVAHWYEAREPVTIGDDATAMPLTVASLIKPYSMVRL